MGVLVVGSIALDSVETPSGKVAEVLGGSATYFSICASFFGGVKLVGVVGEDFPRQHIKFLSSRGVDLAGLKREKGRTFRWSGRYHEDLNQRDTLSLELNVFEKFNPRLPASYENENYVFLANIDPSLQAQVLNSIKKPKLVACDTMDHWIASKKGTLVKTLRAVDIFMLNDSEAKQLTQTSNLVQAANEIFKWGPKVVVIKKGEHGAVLFKKSDSGNDIFTLPAFPVGNAQDPTGAGDSFAGGFMGFLAKKAGNLSQKTLRQAMAYGTVAASYCVERFSIERFHSLSLREMRDRYKLFRKIVAIPGED